MGTEIIMPKLGQTMDEGAIVEWVKQEGDAIRRGDVLFTVESDKAVLEVEATTRGYLRQIVVPQGETVPVLTVVGLVTRTLDEELDEPDKAGTAPGSPEPEVPPPAAAQKDSMAFHSERSGRIFASPRARKAAVAKGIELKLVTGSGPESRIVEQDVLDFEVSLPKATPVAVKTADAMGVDIGAVRGTGPAGRITQEDVRAAAQPAGEPAPVAAVSAAELTQAPDAERVPLSGMRRIIAERMSASDRDTARVTLVTEADATELVNLRGKLKDSVSEEWGFAPGYNDFLGLFAARSLREFPYMNARLHVDEQAIERLPVVNLGLAVDTERGLLVPVVRDAGTMRLREFGTEFRALVDRARAGRSLPDDLSGGTFTITNLGMHDVDAFTPIINPPEAAILGTGRIQPKPAVKDGAVVVREMWTLSLTFDHRLVDGAPAARFLQRIKQLIENPYLLLA
ncbi:dihydrolipoamide acetyltransferase family protein [Chloroflexota bacterium]